LVDDDAEARARQRVQEPAEQRGDEDAEKKRALHRTRFRAWYRTAITTRSHAVRTIWSGPIFDPDTSVQRCKGTSTKSAGRSGGSPCSRRPISSTSNAQRDANGVASALRTAGVSRKNFAPHCVSKTRTPRTSDAAVANSRPR